MVFFGVEGERWERGRRLTTTKKCILNPSGLCRIALWRLGDRCGIGRLMHRLGCWGSLFRGLDRFEELLRLLRRERLGEGKLLFRNTL